MGAAGPADRRAERAKRNHGHEGVAVRAARVWVCAARVRARAREREREEALPAASFFAAALPCLRAVLALPACRARARDQSTTDPLTPTPHFFDPSLRPLLRPPGHPLDQGARGAKRPRRAAAVGAALRRQGARSAGRDASLAPAAHTSAKPNRKSTPHHKQTKNPAQHPPPQPNRCSRASPPARRCCSKTCRPRSTRCSTRSSARSPCGAGARS